MPKSRYQRPFVVVRFHTKIKPPITKKNLSSQTKKPTQNTDKIPKILLGLLHRYLPVVKIQL